MENLFDDDDSPQEETVDVHNPAGNLEIYPAFPSEPSAMSSIKTDGVDEGIDLCSTDVLLDIVDNNPTALIPRVLPGAMDKRVPESSIMEFFSTPGTHFMHIQMPNAMPGLDKDRTLQKYATGTRETYRSRQVEQPSNAQASEDPLSYNTSRLPSLPSGKLGRIRIHRSGKIRLHVGDHVFNFSHGNRLTCKHQVGCLLEENNEFLFLGNYRKKFVVSPDFEAMWKHQ
ncbi:DNA-directed RNA polymerase III subunit, putative [Babesia ovis]|uniref:DNA-directed RNA polymerase III subunit, putative n=1 Tax=Babesia ovis TaxID=5869 RepID=A0A9W5TC45_BABOV|nr:DNA-directed RNA polymerase III subunit, putative [Babesia ovis]